MNTPGSSAALATALLFAQPGVAAAAAAERAYQFDIPRQPLSQALRSFALTTNSSVIYPSGRIRDEAGAVRGLLTRAEALRRLLEGTRFEAATTPNGVYRVFEKAAAPMPPPPRLDRASPRPPAIAGSGPAPTAAPPTVGLDEVVVTATRQLELLDRVPLSISAFTQRSLDDQSVRRTSDLANIVPSLMVTQIYPGVANVAIRGIVNPTTAASAPTTGFYLDDTPLQKRNTGGGFGTNNGTPLLPLFDLDRVEVLRGPQGTLFGSSSQGGTVRYITPTPSLTAHSKYLRAEVGQLRYGGATSDVGVAVGGPLVTDKLAARVTGFYRRDAGYIDYVSVLGGTERFKDANSGEVAGIRGVLLWAATPRLNVALSHLHSNQKSRSSVSSFTLPTREPIVELPSCYDTSGITPAAPVSHPPRVRCDALGVTFHRPGFVYGPFDKIGPYDLVTQSGLSPASTKLRVSALTVDWSLPSVSVRSITSRVADESASIQPATVPDATLRTTEVLYGPTPPNSTSPNGGRFDRGLPFSGTLSSFGSVDLPYFGVFDSVNSRRGFVQEVRASSASQGAFSWVTGVYYARMRVRSTLQVRNGEEAISQALYGMTSSQRYGFPPVVGTDGVRNVFSYQDRILDDDDLAVFGEANYWLNDRVRVTAGVRASRVRFRYEDRIRGQAEGFEVPTLENGGITAATESSVPVSPKVAIQYRLNDREMIYALAAKGFRTGGVNGATAAALCNPIIARFGITVEDFPQSYESDTVWNYEVGGKFRLFSDRVQLNVDLYRIDWSNVQTPIAFSGCNIPFLTNGGSARSWGGEWEARARLSRLLDVGVAVGYTNARYLETVTGPPPGLSSIVVVQKGQTLPVPPWTVSVGVRFDPPVSGSLRPYVRADYRWAASYRVGFYGSPGYSPDSDRATWTSRLNLRVGVERGPLNLALFVNNVLGEKRGNLPGGSQYGGGRSGCTLEGGPECRVYSQYNPLVTVNWGEPRQIGLHLSYRD